MMTNYHRNNNFNVKVVVVVGFLVVLSVLIGTVRIFFGSTFTQVGKPFWHAYDLIGEGFSVPITLFKAKLSLEQEVQILRQRVSIANEREYLSKSLELENTELKKMAGRIELNNNFVSPFIAPPFSVSKNPKLAVVISRPGISLYDTLIIDRGSNQGIDIGDIVLSAGGTLLGKIDETYGESSRVVLMSYPGRKIQVLVGSERLSSTAEGMGGGVFIIKMPENSFVKIGDVVETTESEPWIIGTIGSIDIEKSSALKTVYVKSPVNFQQMKWVVVAHNKLTIE